MYVDGYVLPVPKKNLDAYKEMATVAGKVWMELGALSFVECAADDVKPGVHTSFPQAVKLEEGETVIFSWITFKSKEDRDRINAAVMQDPRLKCQMETLQFDGKRMFWGGFVPIVQL